MVQYLFSYFRQRVGRCLLFLTCCLVFFAAFLFYHLPVQAVLYPAVICAGLLLAFLAADCFLQYRKLRTLHRLSKTLREPEYLKQTLARYQSQDDAAYQELIGCLLEERRQIAQAQDSRYNDLTDYYTTWVHQIKTPIASMRLTLGNEDSLLSRKVSEELFKIEQYVEMVLAYLRLDSDSTDYVFRKYAMDDIVRQTIRKFAGQFIGRGIRLNYTPVGLEAVTDEKWLMFVLEQIISNALKYTASGSIDIFAEGETTICIRDSGIGIAEEDLPRIFEKGYTGCNGRRDKRASGLGLYLSKRVCEQLGHTISVESVPDAGTTVRICMGQAGTERVLH